MLIRISLILAIVAALAAGALNVVMVKDKINTLVTDRNTQRDGRISAEGEREIILHGRNPKQPVDATRG